MAWTEESKARVVEMYKERNPTPENSTELVKQIADELEESANGVRMVLMQAGVYVKKDAAASTSKSASGEKKSGEGSKRVSKEDAIGALKKAIEDAGKEVDEDILSKLTGKAAVYFAGLLA